MPIIEGAGGSLSQGYGPFRSAGVPTTAFNGFALPGAQCIDTTNAKLYINTGTLASNTWTVAGLQT